MLLRACELDAFDVIYPFEVRSPLGGTSPQEQLDGVLYWRGPPFLVEAKNWTGDVPFGPVATLVSHLNRRPPTAMGVVFSSKGFTEPAAELLHLTGSTRVLLWSGPEIEWALAREGRFREGLQAKYRAAVERALPDYNLLERAA